ncbi:MAG: 30S ribosomal protein S17 [Nanohaloarchaea archaeon SW_7_43_1]|nr:MAG: 30S ribosomal protein S17 [Nanohaloarchaea archaeon SW_7_43_1]
MAQQEAQKSTSIEFPTRGSSFTGTVESTKMEKSATVRWEHSQKVPKYERYERRNTKITSHVPEDLEVEEGDEVRIEETKPISKTKSTVITEIIEE